MTDGFVWGGGAVVGGDVDVGAIVAGDGLAPGKDMVRRMVVRCK